MQACNLHTVLSTKGIPTIRTTDMSFDGSTDLKDSPCISLSKAEMEKFGLQDVTSSSREQARRLASVPFMMNLLGLPFPEHILFDSGSSKMRSFPSLSFGSSCRPKDSNCLSAVPRQWLNQT